jgi:hypothetical protein
LDIGTGVSLVFAGMIAAATVMNSIVQFQTSRRSTRNEGTLHEIHLTMNSRLDQLVAARVAAAHGEGIAAERAASVIDPKVTALAAANVLTVAREAKAALLSPLPVHVVTDDAPVAVQVVPAPAV